MAALRTPAVVAGVLLVLVSAAGQPDESGDCGCSRIFSPQCSTTSGIYVGSNDNCVQSCGGYPVDTVDCIFLRYYSWRRRCTCNRSLEGSSEPVCMNSTGVIKAKSEACAECLKMEGDQYVTCDQLKGDLYARYLYEGESCGPRGCACNATVLEPQCSMATGKRVACSECEAIEAGHTHTAPCWLYEGATTENVFLHDLCLEGPEGATQVGKTAGYVGCLAVIHKCVDFLPRDGGMVHVLCMPDETCAATAATVPHMMPECQAALEHGTPACRARQANRIFDEAVEALCKELGDDDFI
mmetsp:Transcript_20943/g.53672  ORF Transcript_20943/g.53672 Transcript_20943/m.53672 type:complete len:298 (-) Transcript_20943:135-1028(-)